MNSTNGSEQHTTSLHADEERDKVLPLEVLQDASLEFNTLATNRSKNRYATVKSSSAAVADTYLSSYEPQSLESPLINVSENASGFYAQQRTTLDREDVGEIYMSKDPDELKKQLLPRGASQNIDHTLTETVQKDSMREAGKKLLNPKERNHLSIDQIKVLISKRTPEQVPCPNCKKLIITRVSVQRTREQICCFVLMLMTIFLIPCAYIIYMNENKMDYHHECPDCKYRIATYNPDKGSTQANTNFANQPSPQFSDNSSAPYRSKYVDVTITTKRSSQQTNKQTRINSESSGITQK